jgi:hypothetical protein
MQTFLTKLKIKHHPELIRQNEPTYQYLKAAQTYYFFLVGQMSLKNRLLHPHLWSHGKKGLRDVIWYMSYLCENPADSEAETSRFLTGGKSQYVHDSIFSHQSKSSLQSNTWNTIKRRRYKYSDTTSSKYYSRIHFFEHLPEGAEVNEIFSAKWLAHHTVTNILLITLTITSSTLFALHQFKILHFLNQPLVWPIVGGIIGLLFLLKFVGTQMQPIFAINTQYIPQLSFDRQYLTGSQSMSAPTEEATEVVMNRSQPLIHFSPQNVVT